jgi:fucose permease
LKLKTYYDVSYTVISLVFLAPFIGYTLAAIFNNKIHMRFGRLGPAFIGPLCKIICYAVTSAKPPYAVLPIIFAFSGFGNGLLDGGFNAWVGDMIRANE